MKRNLNGVWGLRTAGWSLWVGLALAAAGCADLEPVEAGICGNLIVEQGEVCDGDDARGRCRAAGQPDACRYDCSESPCPDGLVCGTGQVCRTVGICGNGVVEQGEQCDTVALFGVCRAPDQAGGCRYDCTASACPLGYRCLETGVCDDENVCGNGVAEPENGEDCDGLDPVTAQPCRPPGLVGECRYDCAVDGRCIDGYGCGSDGICRSPSGAFVATDERFGDTLGLAAGDFDGDGRSDAVQVTPSGYQVRFYDGGAVQEALASLAVSPAPPAIGDVTGDGLADVALRVRSKFSIHAGELAVLAARADRSFRSLVHPTENLPGTALAVDAIPPQSTGDLVLFFEDTAHGYSFSLVQDPNNNDNVLFGTTAELTSGLPQSSDLLGATAGPLVSTVDCQHVVGAWRDDPVLRVIRPCLDSGGDSGPPWNEGDTPVLLGLPGGHHPWAAESDGANPGGAVFVVELNGDSQPDLLVPTVTNESPQCLPANCTSLGCVHDGVCLNVEEDCVCADCLSAPECTSCDKDGICDVQLETCACSDCASHPNCPGADAYQVAYGLGDGHFDDNPLAIWPSDTTRQLAFKTVANFQCPLQYGPLGAPLLAVGHFNDDGISDLVTGLGIYVSTPAGDYSYTMCPQSSWGEAVAADFDGNGTLDVVATTSGTTLEFLSGVGDGTFTAVTIAAGGFSSQLRTADFDGDSLPDAAFLRHPIASPVPASAADIMVAFGSALSAPETPVPVATVAAADRLAAGRFLLSDGAAELAIQTAKDPRIIFLRGSGTRQFLSTFVLRETEPAPFSTFTGIKSMDSLVFGSFAVPSAQPEGTQVTLAVQTAQQGFNQRLEHVATGGDDALVELRTLQAFDCLVAGVECPEWRLVAVDLDGDEIDSVVGFADDELVVFGKGQPPTIVDRLPTGFALYRGRESVHGAMVGRPQAVDVDADGRRDVAILSDDGQVHLFWNDGLGSLDVSDAGRAIVTPAAGLGLPFRAATFLNLAGDEVLELVTLDSWGARARPLDPETRSFGDSRALAVPTGDIVESADVDGDGVTDLLIGDSLGIVVLRALAVMP